VAPESTGEGVQPQSRIARRRSAAQTNSNAGYVARKQRILEAAAIRFTQQGFDSADLADIAADAGIERANIYYYVESKEDLYVQVLLAVKGDVVPAAEKIARSKDPAPVRLRRLMVDLMSEIDRQYPYLYFHYREIVDSMAPRFPLNPQIRKVRRLGERHFETFRSVVRDGLRDGSFVTDLPAGIVAEAAIGMIIHSGNWFDSSKSRYSSTHVGGAFADMLLTGLAAPGCAPQFDG
jgi:TetR/AcrR family transcriptional regulator, cholesterol catabolism regulator